jgi:hypothetical protein
VDHPLTLAAQVDAELTIADAIRHRLVCRPEEAAELGREAVAIVLGRLKESETCPRPFCPAATSGG